MTCAGVVGVVALLNLFTGWPSGVAYHVLVVAAGSGFFALLYALAALFFTYGDLREPTEE
jgi:hypothetical protein